MKTVMLFLLFVYASAFADKYTEQMTKNIEVVYKATTAEELQNAVNAFERIGGAEKTKWEPYYYASFGYIMIALKENDPAKKDAILDLAKTALDKSTAIRKDESEIVALEGFIYMIRISVDPASRGQQYSTMASQSYGKALSINPQNPRALSLLAQLQFGTASFFKQQPIEACATAKKAMESFGDTPAGITIAPSWGREMTAGLVKGCN